MPQPERRPIAEHSHYGNTLPLIIKLIQISVSIAMQVRSIQK